MALPVGEVGRINTGTSGRSEREVAAEELRRARQAVHDVTWRSRGHPDPAQRGRTQRNLAEAKRKVRDLGGQINVWGDRVTWGDDGEADDPLSRAEEIQEKIEGLTEGRIEQLEADPDLNSVDDYFRGAMEGENVPYTDAVKAQMATSVGRSTAAAEDAQMQAAQDYLGRVGGNPNDPAYQAMLRGITGNRQGANQQAQNEIALQSALANYQARTGGAESLYQTRMGRMAQGDQMARFRANQLAKRADMGSNAPSEIGGPDGGRQRMVIGDDDIDHRPQGGNAGYGSYAPARKDSVEQRVAKKYGQNVAHDKSMIFPQQPKDVQGPYDEQFLHETQYGGGRPSGPRRY